MGAKRLCHPHPSAAVEKNLKSKIKSRDFWGGGGGRASRVGVAPYLLLRPAEPFLDLLGEKSGSPALALCHGCSSVPARSRALRFDVFLRRKFDAKQLPASAEHPGTLCPCYPPPPRPPERLPRVPRDMGWPKG